MSPVSNKNRMPFYVVLSICSCWEKRKATVGSLFVEAKLMYILPYLVYIIFQYRWWCISGTHFHSNRAKCPVVTRNITSVGCVSDITTIDRSRTSKRWRSECMKILMCAVCLRWQPSHNQVSERSCSMHYYVTTVLCDGQRCYAGCSTTEAFSTYCEAAIATEKGRLLKKYSREWREME